jgi:Xaa-Pro aminopeptidase
MYELARQIVQPGINELEVFGRLQQAAVEELGEMLTGTGNDYACNARGGPPRDREAQAGELYILDLGPAFRGYFADNCRTLSVDRRPTDAQLRAWEKIAEVFPIVERSVRPGVSCRAFYHEIKQMMDDYLPGVFDHHLGHGIGLFPHEGPHLNPAWDDVFEAGDVFTVEPGLYAPDLRAGIRLENDYLVTRHGVELLSDFPLEL